MAKMFYTLDEAAARLGKSPDEVTKMAASGQIQEFRDRDKLMFKKEQIDLLAGDDDTAEPIGLADSADNKAIEDKEESVLGLMDSKESTGISIFDSDDLEKADPSAATQVSDSISPAGFSLDPHASGSGLLDLTREADDTSLGAVLDDINYPGEEEAAQSGGASGLFASPAGEVAAAPGGAMVMPASVEYYDGAGSGLAVGLAIGSLISLAVSTLVVFTALVGDQTVAGIAQSIAGNLWMYVGIFAGVTLIAGIIGWFVGKTFQ